LNYSDEVGEDGAEQTSRRGVERHGFLRDLFKLTPEEVGQYDFVVIPWDSAEHLTDLVGVIGAISKFVKPGGILLTETPNLRSMHGLARMDLAAEVACEALPRQQGEIFERSPVKIGA